MDLIKSVIDNDLEAVKAFPADQLQDSAFDEYNTSVLNIAAGRGFTDVIKALIEKGLDPSHSNNFNYSPLMSAACNDQTECLNTLLDSGADIDKSDNSGKQALHYACESGSFETISNLVYAGADVNKTTEEKLTPSIYLMFNENPDTIKEAIELFRDYEADFGFKDKSGKSALDYAKEKGIEL